MTSLLVDIWGSRKTRQRIKYSFYWPTIKQDVKRFCESCKICQLRKPITYRDRVPIQPLVRPEIPFEVWSVWTVLGRWNLLREGTIILLFAQLIYARDGQSHTCQGNKRQDYVQRPSENFHTNRFSENDLF
ncbi:retrovirus-related Pol polyprotein from transposon opus [Trichonephila clavipes]|nr:retrovirus-related Pol polyprotein from transposon opus [Trichonephila clavipes]